MQYYPRNKRTRLIFPFNHLTFFSIIILAQTYTRYKMRFKYLSSGRFEVLLKRENSSKQSLSHCLVWFPSVFGSIEAWHQWFARFFFSLHQRSPWCYFVGLICSNSPKRLLNPRVEGVENFV